MDCIKCGHANTRVVDSRDHGDYVRRRRKCRKCSYRFTTREKMLKDMQSNSKMELALEQAMKNGLLALRYEKNPHLKVSYHGKDTLVSSKWNVKIYNSGAIVCNDVKVLDDIILGKLSEPNGALEVIQVDDSGWGSVVGGVMLGFFYKGRMTTAMVDVGFFRGDKFKKKEYLKEYSRKGQSILDDIGASPETHRIEICTGYINTVLKDDLRDLGYDVRVMEIKGSLQDGLEEAFRRHIRELTGHDFAYDPKKLEDCEIASRYYEVLNWAQKNAPHLLKSGWKSITNG